MRFGRTRFAASIGIAATIAGLVVLESATAEAQAWLSDRRYSQGPGISISDNLVLHPGIAIEGGYDTNVFRRNENTDGAGRLRITPQIELATLPPQRVENPDGTTSTADRSVDFHINVAAIYNQYLATGARADTIMDQSDVAIQSGLGLTVFPARPWSFVLRNTFTRTTDPSNEDGPANYNRDYDALALGARWTPSGGAFELNLLAGFAFNIYEEGGTIGNIGNYLAPSAQIAGRWKFYPNTALTFDTSFTYMEKYNADGGTGAGDYMIASSFPIRTWLGLNGQWTPLIASALRIGYGAGIYETARVDDFDSVLAQAEVTFVIGPTATVKVGFIRDFVDSFFSNFYIRNQGYVRWEQMFAGAFLVSALANFGYLEFGTLYNSDGTPAATGAGGEVSENPRTDYRVGGSLFLEYRLKDWLGFNATVHYEQTITDFEWTAPAAATDPSEDFWKLTAFAGARFIY